MLSSANFVPPGGRAPLGEGYGGLTLFRSHFLKFLSSLGRIFKYFLFTLGPIFKFLSILGHNFFLFVRSRAIKIGFLARSMVQEN